MTPTYTINCHGHLLTTQTPLIMGILNVTPDSFYDGGKYNTTDQIRARADQILTQGAHIIDLGACSTRPGSTPPTPDQEWSRLEHALQTIRTHHPDAIISIDTYRADIARKAVTQYQADIINDISSLLDPQMLPTIAQLHVPYILTHNPQKPNPTTPPIQHLLQTLSQKINTLTTQGIADIIIDPGLGFAKTTNQNYQILANLPALHTLHRPILIGISRKSMIYNTLNTTPADSLTGTTTLNTLALLAGAHILRVHDITPCAQTIQLLQQLKNNT